MKEWEKNLMCVLLQRLLDKNLITQDIYGKALAWILDMPNDPDQDRKGEICGHTHSPNGTFHGRDDF